MMPPPMFSMDDVYFMICQLSPLSFALMPPLAGHY